MNEGYCLEIKSEIQSAISIIQAYYDRSQSGELMEEEAKESEITAQFNQMLFTFGAGIVCIRVVVMAISRPIYITPIRLSRS